MWETWVQSLGLEDPLEKEMATHSSILACRIPRGCKELHMTGQLHFHFHFSSVQSLSCVQLFATPWIAARQASLSIPNSQSSLKLRSIESVMPSSHLILCRPLLLPPIQSLFQWVNFSHKVVKVWSFSFSIIPSKEIPGLISFRIDWFDLLAVQGNLKSLLQHYSYGPL